MTTTMNSANMKTTTMMLQHHPDTLSGGERQRARIARALAQDCDIIILDEPTAGVDIEIRRSMWEFLREINEQGTTIILTTHYLEEAENLCRNIAIIDHGQIMENTSMKKLLSQLNMETFILDTREEISSASSARLRRTGIAPWTPAYLMIQGSLAPCCE